MRIIFVLLLVFSLFSSCKKEQKSAQDELTQLSQTSLEHFEKTSQNIVKPRTLKNAVLASGILQRVDSFASKYIVARTVDIWLPEGYSKKKEYNVLYMHDGQNLFDATTSWNNQEWKVDEWASDLMKTDSIKDVIVVGIHNIPKLRFLDYYPEKAFDYLDQKNKDSLLEDSKKQGLDITFDDFKGDEYLKFITEELKPFIDNSYATLPDRQHTFIGGASMGGLISMYAMCEYPLIFGGAACISTHWPGMTPTEEKNAISQSIFDYMKANLPTHRFYFDYGTETLDAFYPKYLVDLDTIFLNKGYTYTSYMNLEFEGADHSESSWNRRFDIPLTFLLKK